MDKSKLIYCGFGIYYDKDSGSRFEEVDGKLVEISPDLKDIEMSYVNNAMSKKGALQKDV